jgi:hypothetical protein
VISLCFLFRGLPAASRGAEILGNLTKREREAAANPAANRSGAAMMRLASLNHSRISVHKLVIHSCAVASECNCRFMLIAGLPIDEPVLATGHSCRPRNAPTASTKSRANGAI